MKKSILITFLLIIYIFGFIFIATVFDSLNRRVGHPQFQGKIGGQFHRFAIVAGHTVHLQPFIVKVLLQCTADPVKIA